MRTLDHLKPYRTAHDKDGGLWDMGKTRVVASWGAGWDHVSVTITGHQRCPTWEEMMAVKTLFFKKEETVVQFHPKESEYVNTHPYCLHLWRRQNEEYELPPKWMVG